MSEQVQYYPNLEILSSTNTGWDTAYHPLGYEYVVQAGIDDETKLPKRKTFVFVKNASASALATAVPVQDNAVRTPFEVRGSIQAPDGVDSRAYRGIAVQAIGAGKYGFVQTKGECIVKAAAGVTFGPLEKITPGSGGVIKKGANTNVNEDVCGYMIEAIDEAGGTGLAYLNGSFS